MFRFVANKREYWAKERISFLKSKINFFPKMKILDLGGYDGVFMDKISTVCNDLDITISDIDKNALEIAKSKGYKTIHMDGSVIFPFADNEFDLIFCNSVIEHVTIPKTDVWMKQKNKKFESDSFKFQSLFAKEIRRCAKHYFVQTPHKYFIIESHTWFPFVGYFSHNSIICIVSVLNKFWIKKSDPDWYLLSGKQMKELFPNAQIFTTKKIGFPKEIIAIDIL